MRSIPNAGVLDGRALKKQVIGYGERTMGEIVEAYVNPIFHRGMDLGHWQGEEFIFAQEGLTLIRCRVWHGGTQGLPAGATVMPTTSKKARLSSSARADAGGRALLYLQQIDTLWREHLQAMDALRESVGLRLR